MSILNLLNNKLIEIFKKLDFDIKYAVFTYSDRQDLGDFQTNASMVLCKILKKKPIEISQIIVDELKKDSFFDKISIDGPGFINVSINNNELINYINTVSNENYLGFIKKDKQKTVIIDFSSPNVAKEMHVGHLRSTVIGESLRRIFLFCGDKVLGDNHLGDWGTPMGMVIEGIRIKYPNIECFQKNFNKDKITDLNLTATDLLEIYKLGSGKFKEDKIFEEKVKETTKLLQDGYKPYNVLWKYFWNISINDCKDIYKILGSHFDLWNGESSVHNLNKIMIDDLTKKNIIIESNGAKIIDLSEYDMPPLIMEKSDGAYTYDTSDVSTVLDRINKYNPDLMLYVVDYRQSLHFKQLFKACEKIGYLNDKVKAEHIAFGTMNGKDGKPFKTRSGDTVKLRELIDEMIDIITKKSSLKSNKETIQKIAVACLIFSDLSNYRESSYIFDMEQFTNFEGRTGAYILYSIVRINSILSANSMNDYNITEIKTKEERELLIELTKFSQIIEITYNKRAPNFLAEYVYNLAKKFSSFYSVCSINNENNLIYKQSKLSLIYITKKYIEKSLYLLGISTVEKM